MEKERGWEKGVPDWEPNHGIFTITLHSAHLSFSCSHFKCFGEWQVSKNLIDFYLTLALQFVSNFAMLGVSCKQKLVFYYSYSNLAVHAAEYLLISLVKSHVVPSI